MSLLALAPPGRLSCSLWGDEAMQVSNDKGIARIWKNSHSSLDLLSIKTYYWIVRMQKVKLPSDNGGTKEAKAEN